MINTDKYEGHTPAPWKASNDFYKNGIDENNLGEVASFRRTWGVTLSEEPLDDGRKNHIGYYTMHIADAQLIADAPILLEFIQKVVKEWGKPNQCNQAFGKDVRHLMLEYGLINYNEETRRYEVKE